MDTLLVFYTPRHTPNYPANDSVQKAQNKCIPARKVKKDKLQMNQGKATLKEIISLFFWKKKQRISRTTKVQQFYLFAIFVPPQNIGCLSDEDSIFTQEDIQAVWSHHPGILCTVLGHQHPPPPPARTASLQWFATRTPTVFLHPNAKSRGQKTLHRLFTVFVFILFWHGGAVSSTPLEIPS